MSVSDDKLTKWLSSFLLAWVGLAIGSVAIRWISGAEFSSEVIAVRAVIAFAGAVVIATYYYLKDKA